MNNSRKSLGRGLSALFANEEHVNEEKNVKPQTLPLIRIRTVVQPRVDFRDEGLQELAESIKQNGLIQPIVVRPLENSDDYAIIAGERRYRACKRVGLSEVPVIVRKLSEAEAYELALIENIQREDLGPIEEAEAYAKLMQDRGYKQEELAQRMGKSRSAIANSLRLLNLPESVRQLIADGELTAGHARAILGCSDDPAEQEALADKCVKEHWSVRQIEDYVKALNEPKETVEKEPTPRPSGDVAVEDQLRAVLGAPVHLVQRQGKGKLEIKFHSVDELQRLIELLEMLRGL